MTALPVSKTAAPPTPIRMGLVAPESSAGVYRESISGSPAFELTAQGGLPQIAVASPAAWYDDLRVMIAQGPIDAVVLAAAPRTNFELACVAVDQGKHVLLAPPLARNFAEAVELIRRAECHESILRVCSFWEHASVAITSVRGVDSVASLGDAAVAPYLSEILASSASPPPGSHWLSVGAGGGGALPSECYDATETLVALRGLPESVFAAIGKSRARTGGPPRDTEDYAEVLLRFESGVARITARWDLPPLGRYSVHHVPGATLRIRDGIAERLSPAGDCSATALIPGNRLAAELARFERDVRSRATAETLRESLRRQLAVSAIIEAAYLSSKTGQPESPRRLYEAQRCEEWTTG